MRAPEPPRPDVPAGGLRLDLGCGKHKREGYRGVDLVAQPGVDVVCDVEAPFLPFRDETVDHVHSAHLLEHIGHGPGPVDGFVRFMNECWRVLKVGGAFEATMPHASCPGAFADPTHKRFLNEYSFLYFGYMGSPEKSLLGNGRVYGFRGLFRIVHCATTKRSDYVSELAVYMFKERPEDGAGAPPA